MVRQISLGEPVILTLLTFSAALSSLASAQPTGEHLKLSQLVEEALRANPEIVAAQKRYEAARQRPPQESTLPDPMISLGYASVGSPRPIAGLGRDPNAGAGLMITQEIPFPGKLSLRGALSSREAAAEFQQYEQVRLGVVSRVKQAYFRLYNAYAAAGVLQRNRDLLTRLLRVTEARYSVGRAAQQDVLKAQTQIGILDTRLVMLESERRSREAEINSLLNRPPDTPVARPEDVRPQQLALSLKELYGSAVESSPMLRRDENMIQRSELAVNLAKKEYYPDFAVNAGYTNMGLGMPAMYEARVDVKVPLFFWRKQRAGVAEQAANLSESRRAYEATRQNLNYRIKEDYTMAEAASTLVSLYQNTVLPEANLTLESSLASYETGQVDFLSVLTNFGMVLEYEMNYYAELTNYYTAVSRLEEMTARRLIS